ncbi:MAG: hypothetical protein WBX07_19355, partial [Rhodoplanes sp.]
SNPKSKTQESQAENPAFLQKRILEKRHLCPPLSRFRILHRRLIRLIGFPPMHYLRQLEAIRRLRY